MLYVTELVTLFHLTHQHVKNKLTFDQNIYFKVQVQCVKYSQVGAKEHPVYGGGRYLMNIYFLE